MSRHAFMGMYDLPAQATANDALWAAIAHILIDRGVPVVPATLTRHLAPDTLWHDPGLLLGQACGYPLVARDLPLRVVALPVYAVRGCADARHCSLLVTRASGGAEPLTAFRGRHAAINDPWSNTGMNLFRAAIAPVARADRFFASVTITGSHRESIRAILRGEADLAAIDAVTFAGLKRYEPDLVHSLRIVGETPSSPTLPFVTARDAPDDIVAALYDALAAVIADPALAGVRDVLALSGIVPAQPDHFTELDIMARHAAEIGYPHLA